MFLLSVMLCLYYQGDDGISGQRGVNGVDGLDGEKVSVV